VQDKVVLITGGAKRVGAAICRHLHASGARLMLHYRASAGEARLLQAELNGVRADSVALIQADLLDLAKLPSLVDQTVMRFGRLDALVNNASSFFATPIGDIQPAQWDDLMARTSARRCSCRRPRRRRSRRRRARSSTSATSTPSGRCATTSSTRSPRPR
jgi:NAD(P)-dependent dehydrogenase (short-subunit alcohol dehydrogenase family)